MRPRGFIIGLLGVWLIIAAIWRFAPLLEIWSDVAAGLIIAILGFSFVNVRPWNGWVSGIAGLWMIVAAFVPGLHSGVGILVNNIATGIVVMAAGFTALRTDDRERSIRAA